MSKKAKLLVAGGVVVLLAVIVVAMNMPRTDSVEPDVADAAARASAEAAKINPPEPEQAMGKRGGASKSK